MNVYPQIQEWHQRAGQFLRTAGADVGDLVSAVSCAGCGGYGIALCDECWLQWQTGVKRVENEVSALQLRSQFPLWAAASYELAVRQTIVALKDRGRLDVLDVVTGATMRLAERIAPVFEECLPAQQLPVIVVPVPARKPIWLSGREIDLPTHFGQDLVSHMGRFDLPALLENALRTRGWSRDQVGLDRIARRKNRRGTMRIRTNAVDLENKPVLVVDDVATTDATMSEAARELTRAGGAVVGGAVLAVTKLRKADAGPLEE